MSDKSLYKAIRLIATGKQDEAISILIRAASSMGGLGQCNCCCGNNPSSANDPGFGESGLRFPPKTIGHELDCDLALTLYKLGETVVFKGSFTEEDRLKFLETKEK